MRASNVLLLFLAALALLPGIGSAAGDDSVLPLIPAPVSVSRSPGYFTLRRGAPLVLRADNAQALGVARYFITLVDETSQLHLDLRPHGGSANDAIEFVLDPRFVVSGDSIGEGYELVSSPHGIRLTARTSSGLFYGSITLWQLLAAGGGEAPLHVPRVAISDYPRFAWRGLMLDSARHFQSPDCIRRLLDQMAQHKLNVLHWHLTDDQGWRIEIRKYPKLTEIGAFRTPAAVAGTPERYGGYYTQDDIRAIVRYASERFITIVPEIEMPGHAQAAIAAYPQFGVTGARPPVSHDWGVHAWLFNVDEATFAFLDDVLGEVMDLFPGTYIHVGGDEAAKGQWQASPHLQQRMHELGVADENALQGYFTGRIEKFLAAHGRKLIGWDEILAGGVPARATVMSWRGTAGGIEAARKGHDVVMAPSPLMYFDHYQSALHDEPPGRPEIVSLADVYAYEPVPRELDAAQAAHVLGAQAALWSEYLDSRQRMEHAAFPRAAALAEVLWSPPARRNWADFLARLPAQFARYRAADIAFADSVLAPDIRVHPDAAANHARVEIVNQSNYGEIRYALNGSSPGPDSPVYESQLSVPLPSTLSATTFADDVALAGRSRNLDSASLLRMNSDELPACSPDALILRLPGPSTDGERTVYRVDIFDPCWIYPRVNLDAVQAVTVTAAERPYNFQLAKDVSRIVKRASLSSGDELQVHLDRCDGEVLAAIPLRNAADKHGIARLQAQLPRHAGTHDLCFAFARAAPDPLWMIDTIQLLAR
jgi:hexosaminidase